MTESPFLLLMPSYNQAHYIARAVESVLAQSDPNWELWILDNSSDATPAVMAQYSDSRIHFIHDPERCDPGTCLNRLLAMAKGEAFSYIHTDNLLGEHYVARFRGVLKRQRFALAYCDHWMMDEHGNRMGAERRRPMDLGNLLGGHGLGVPFSATTDLLTVIGGFSRGDLADDVRFCNLAWGLGPWFHLREPLMDYRVHGGSRAEGGGSRDLLHALMKAHARVLPVLEARGFDPLRAMGHKLRDILVQLDATAGGEVYRLLGRSPKGLGDGTRLFPLWNAGLIRLPNFGHRAGGPRKRMGLAFGIKGLRLRFRLQKLQFEVNRLQPEFRSLLLGWAWLKAGANSQSRPHLLVGSPGLGSLWAAQILSRELGWSVALDERRRDWPTWCRWPKGQSAEGDLWLDLDEGQPPPAGLKDLSLPLDPLCLMPTGSALPDDRKDGQ